MIKDTKVRMPTPPLSPVIHPASIQNSTSSCNERVFARPEKSHLHQSCLSGLSGRAEARCGSWLSCRSILPALSRRKFSNHRLYDTVHASGGHCRTRVPEPLQENLRSL